MVDTLLLLCLPFTKMELVVVHAFRYQHSDFLLLLAEN
jgi:hypothetical protein